MKNLKAVTKLNSKELTMINGGSFLALPVIITWPIIIPFGDPSDWDQGVPVM